MTPATLLDLWRDRWAKPAIDTLFVPYRDSALNQRLEAFALSSAWRSRSWRWLVLVCSGLIALGVMALPLTSNAQIVFAFSIMAVVVYARRFAGGMLPLILACVSLVLSLRYFFWRVDTTLPTNASTLDFAWAFALWSAEFFLWLGSALVVIQRLWPLRQKPHRIEEPPVAWPAVDIVLWLEHATLAQLQTHYKIVQALEWPAQRITLHAICTHEPAPDIQAWAQTRKLPLTHMAPSVQHPWEQINQFGKNLSAPFVWVLDVRSPPTDPRFLQNTLGWFTENPSLGLLHTPLHPLASTALSQAPPELLNSIDGRAQHVLMRRSALEDIARANMPPPSAHTATGMRQTGWEHAWLMVSTHSDPASPAITCIYAHLPAYALQGHLLLDALRDRCLFYRPLARALWMLTPVALLWLKALPVQSTLLPLAAFFLPHWLMAQLAMAASDNRGRLTLSLLLRELVLPLHLLIRTAQSFVRTQCQHLGQHWLRRSGVRDPALPWSQWGASLTWIGLNTWACIHALHALHLSSQPWSGSVLIVLALWAAWNAMQAIGTLAVEKEGQLVKQTHAQRQNVEAMVQWSGQRPLPCVASNFPQTALILECPATVHWLDQPQPAQPVFFSLFHGYHEYTFEGHITTIQANRLQLQVAPADLRAYHALASAIFSRDAQWPRWLPARDADRLLPSRVRTLLNILETAFYNLTVQASLALWMQRLRKWLRPGNHHHV